MLRARVAEARLAMLLLTRIPVGYLRDPIPATGASAWGWPLAGAVAMLPAGLIYWALHAAGEGRSEGRGAAAAHVRAAARLHVEAASALCAAAGDAAPHRRRARAPEAPVLASAAVRASGSRPLSGHSLGRPSPRRALRGADAEEGPDEALRCPGHESSPCLRSCSPSEYLF